MKRYLHDIIVKSLDKKMVFLSGPRQVGKTTLGLWQIGPKATEDHPGYINWDSFIDRDALIKGILPNEPLIVFDEIHKYHAWRNFLKGVYDQYKRKHHFLITGSARLDIYRRGGDSLHGRYYSYRLHPFSLNEIDPGGGKKLVESLMKFGGFPEPFLQQDEREYRLWARERQRRIIKEDIADLEKVRELAKIDLLADLINQKVSSLLSINSLVKDLQASFNSISKWLDILEAMYLIFRIKPYTNKLARSINKERKLYYWDWAQTKNQSARFENLVASHMLKYCHYLEDYEGLDVQLHYLRDKEGREVDFLLVKDDKPYLAVECKLGEKDLSPHLSYFKRKIGIKKLFQVHCGTIDRGDERGTGRILPFHRFSKEVLPV